MFRKGQVETITALILVGIFITSIGAVYIWGLPLIEKRQATSEIDNADRFVQDLAEAIRQVALSEGSSQRTINRELKGGLAINQETQEITYILNTEYSTYPSTEVILNDWLGADQPGIIGTNQPGVISVSAEEVEKSNFIIRYRLSYRELVNPDTQEGTVIIIETPKNNIAEAGTAAISISKGEQDIQTSASSLGGDRITTAVQITLN